jgi:Tol biopolymer transport system component
MNRKRVFLWMMAALALAVCLPAQQAAPPEKKSPPAKRNLTIDDLFQIKRVGNPEISPEEKWVAYTISTTSLRDERSETQVWMIPLAGGEAIPMTAKGASSSSPQWSPDGKFLAILTSRSTGQPAAGAQAAGGGEGPRSQVWLLDGRGGEAQQLTEVRQGIGSFAWSPDSTRLVLSIRDPRPEETAEAPREQRPRTQPPWVIDRLQFKQDRTGYLDRRRTHLYVFDVASKKLTQITSGDFEDSQPKWSPDGKLIAFVSNRTEEPDSNFNTDIWLVAADNPDKGQTLVQLTTNPGPDRAPAWSPDGKSIAYVTATDVKNFWYATNYLAVVAVPGADGKVSPPQIVTQKLDRNVSSPEFAPDGKSIYFGLEDQGESHLAQITLATGAITRPIAGARSVGAFALT